MKFWLPVAFFISLAVIYGTQKEDKLANSITKSVQMVRGYDFQAYADSSAQMRKDITIRSDISRNMEALRIQQLNANKNKAWEVLDEVLTLMPKHNNKCALGHELLSIRTSKSKEEDLVSLPLAKQWITYVQDDFCRDLRPIVKKLDFSQPYVGKI